MIAKTEAKYRRGQVVFPSKNHYSDRGLRMIEGVVWTDTLGWRYSEHLFNSNGSGGGYASYNNEDHYRLPETPEERLVANAIEFIFKHKELKQELNIIASQKATALSALDIAGVTHPVIEYNKASK